VLVFGPASWAAINQAISFPQGLPQALKVVWFAGNAFARAEVSFGIAVPSADIDERETLEIPDLNLEQFPLICPPFVDDNVFSRCAFFGSKRFVGCLFGHGSQLSSRLCQARQSSTIGMCAQSHGGHAIRLEPHVLNAISVRQFSV
jgi:hypothetical protein